MAEQFLKLMQSEDALALLTDHPAAFLLLTQIAWRAKRRNPKSGLQPGQAMIGDHHTIGLTQAEYRTSKNILRMNRLATFRGTNKGTIATLCDSRVYDLKAYLDSDPRGIDKQTTSQTQTNDEPDANGTTSRGDGVKPLGAGGSGVVTSTENKPDNKQDANKRRARRKQTTTTGELRREKGRIKKGEEDPLGVFDRLVGEDERLAALRGVAGLRDVYEGWCGYRARTKKKLTPRAVLLDCLHLARVVDAGGSAADLEEMMDRAEYGDWTGWFHEDAFERWREKRGGKSAQKYRAGGGGLPGGDDDRNRRASVWLG